MLLTRLDLNRCVEGDIGSNSPLELEAIQPYPYHPDLGVHTLLNGFAVCPFTNMLWFPQGFPVLGKLVGLAGVFSSLQRLRRNYLCRHTAHPKERTVAFVAAA
jgi:hypothetical protein